MPEYRDLPGDDSYDAAVEDLHAGVESPAALLVSPARGRLVDAGPTVPPSAVERPAHRPYLTGGATAVLEGWRGTTVDIDVHFEPESDELLSGRQGQGREADARPRRAQARTRRGRCPER